MARRSLGNLSSESGVSRKVGAKQDGRASDGLSDWHRRLLKRLYWRLAPPRVKNYLAVHRLLVEEYGPPEFIPIPQERRLLVLAPHIDDEVIGCGGVIGRLSRLGAEITVVYLTDGRRGNPALYERADLLPEQQKGEE
ncbi:MAG: PIG-L family deacetylase, partial [Chloroflexi bacterium]|nr:PIG-L family deacetylase [Chloroflexota bacterium]